jgi:hypothetical protein
VSTGLWFRSSSNGITEFVGVLVKNIVFQEDYWGYDIQVVREGVFFIATIQYPEGGNYCLPHAYRHYSVAIQSCVNWINRTVFN